MQCFLSRKSYPSMEEMCNIQIIYTVVVFKHFTNLRFVRVAGCIGCLAILCFPT